MNKEILINLNTIEKVKRFIHITNEFNCDIEIRVGKWVVDGKSIMGLFSLNLLEPLSARIDSNKKEEIESFYRVMEEFRWEE